MRSTATLLKSGDKLRVRAQLTDAASGETVWSDNYEFDGEDTLAVQKKTAERIYGAVAGGRRTNCRTIEKEAAWRKPESALTEYDYALRSMDLCIEFTLDDVCRGTTRSRKKD